MKKKYIAILMAFVMITMITTACSNKAKPSAEPSGDTYESAEGLIDENGDIVEQEGSGISFDQEEDGAKLTFVEKDVSKFIGSWTATSDRAIYLYGNIDITVKDDGTWTGNITGEKLGGKWEQKGDRLHMENELFSFDLAFESSGELILIETGDDSNFNTVLTKNS